MKSRAMQCLMAAVAVCGVSLADEPTPVDTSKKEPLASLRKRMPKLKEDPAARDVHFRCEQPERWIRQNSPPGTKVSEDVPARVSPNVSHREDTFRVATGKGTYVVEMLQAPSYEDAMSILWLKIEYISLRLTANVKSDGKDIGKISIQYTVDGSEESAVRTVYFLRGNLLVKVKSTQTDGKYPDPRPLALAIDKALQKEPKAGPASKVTNIPMTVEAIPSNTAESKERRRAIRGRAYRLTFAIPKDPDKRIREVQVRGAGADVGLGDSGQYEVVFCSPGKQQVACYCLDAEGRVIASGATEAVVVEAPRAIDQAEALQGLSSLELGVSDEAQQKLLQQRNGIILELQDTIVRTRSRYPGACRRAMFILGEYRAVESIAILVEAIGFPIVSVPVTDPITGISITSDYSGRLPAGEKLPAVAALIKIGRPVVPEILAKMRSADNVVEQRACTAVLVGVLGQAEAVATIDKAIQSTSDARTKQRLGSSLSRAMELNPQGAREPLLSVDLLPSMPEGSR